MNQSEPKLILGILNTGRDRRALTEALCDDCWKLEVCDRMANARPFLPDASVVVCDDKLVDGNWKDLLARLEVLPSDPPLIVTSRLADERLWAEVLNSGGYDLLAEPFRTEEVVRSVQLASDSLRNDHKTDVG
ncbi:MAG: hypothetical protein WDO73_01555 [Ignavibacteriota bacterium]